MSVKDAFEKFMNDTDALHKAIDSSTVASWSGSGYSAEFFEDGTFRTLWNGSIGNLYESPGMILGIPTLSNEEWDDDEDHRYYDNAEDELQDAFKMHWDANINVQLVIANQD